VAVGQAVERAERVGAIDLAERASVAALREAPGIDRHIGRVSVVNILTRVGPSPARRLARRLRLDDVTTEVSTIGGNTPPWLVGRAASDIAAGRIDAVLIAGSEAQRSQNAPAPSLRTPTPEPHEDLPPDVVVGDDRLGIHPLEMAAGLVVPTQIYPLFESVLAHRAGRTFAEQREWLGELMAPFTEVAAKNPYAWFPEPASPQDISSVSRTNRLIAEPYTKRMNAMVVVDQAAALVVCSLAVARELGLDGQAVFLWSGASVNDVWHVCERPDLGRTPGIAAALGGALDAARCGIDDIGLIDLYSCFPCAVQMGAQAGGIDLDDRRGLTVAGGLPYFGGAGNNYAGHALATTIERLRERGGLGLVTGLGWFVTKHSALVVGADPSPEGWRLADTTAEQAAIDESALPVLPTASGPGTVVAVSVQFDKHGSASSAPAVVALPDGRRVVATCNPDDVASMAGRNVVGCPVELTAGQPPTWRTV